MESLTARINEEEERISDKEGERKRDKQLQDHEGRT